MRNDKERRVFVENPESWETVSEMPGVRLLRLEYGANEWYRLEIWANVPRYDFEEGRMGFRKMWLPIRTMSYYEFENAFSHECVSTTEMVNAIKIADKVERKEKKK